MRICDICKTDGVRYERWVTTKENGDGQKFELCCKCYKKLQEKEDQCAYLAYKETIEEITGESPKKKSRLNIFKR